MSADHDWLEDLPYDPEQPERAKPTMNPLDTLPGLAGYLLGRIEWLRKHDLALAFRDEIKAAVDRCREALDGQGEAKVTLKNAVCLSGDCAGRVVATVPPLHYGNVTIQCQTCETVWQGGEWLAAGGHIDREDVLRPVWVSTAQAALSLGVSDRTVQRWTATGRLACEVRARGQRRIVMVQQADVNTMREAREAGA